MTIHLPHPQYFNCPKKGSKVTFWGKKYTVQQSGDWLYIVITRNGVKQKISVADICKEPGSLQDWIFNGWSQVYPDYEQFASFMQWEVFNN